jgi:hypothetical protein
MDGINKTEGTSGSVEKEGFAERVVEGISNGICDGIMAVSDVLCAPLEFLTGKIIGL